MGVGAGGVVAEQEVERAADGLAAGADEQGEQGEDEEAEGEREGRPADPAARAVGYRGLGIGWRGDLGPALLRNQHEVSLT